MRAPTGTRLEETELLVDRVEQSIRKEIPELATLNDNIGTPTFYNLAFIPSDNVGSQDAEILISLARKHPPSEQVQARIRTRLEREFPEARFYFMPADVITQVLNFGVPAAIDVDVQGRDAEAAFEIARGLYEKVRRVPSAEDVRIAQMIDRPALSVDMDRQRAGRSRTTGRERDGFALAQRYDGSENRILWRSARSPWREPDVAFQE